MDNEELQERLKFLDHYKVLRITERALNSKMSYKECVEKLHKKAQESCLKEDLLLDDTLDDLDKFDPPF